MLRRTSLFALVMTGWFCSAFSAHAVPLIRDAEIEHTLGVYGAPLFRANGLKPSAVNLYIVQDNRLNAYVAGGANMFLNTGMIMACETPDMLLGIMAHETGHIAGGHLARGGEKLKDAQIGGIMTFVLGAAAAAVSGQPEAAVAVLSGGQSAVMRNFFTFTRSNEEAADQSALNTLDALGISASGMVETFALLKRNERSRGRTVDPYMLTHPLTNSRITHVRNHAETSKIPYGSYPSKLNALHQRMRAKLYGFLNSPERTFAHYPKSNRSVAARMARAIAYYKMPDLPQALGEMDSLLSEMQGDPFLHELKGQVLFENNRPEEALASYRTAHTLLPESPLILLDLARVELAQEPPLLDSAITHLETSLRMRADNANGWRLLAGAYGKKNNHGMRLLALSEEAMLYDNPDAALRQVNAALELLPKNTPKYIRAKDVKSYALQRQRSIREDGRGR